jgi:single-strand DNA-binding protein
VNNLNSILIEGVLNLSSFRKVDTEGRTFYSFLLISQRHYTLNNCAARDNNNFEVLASEALVKQIESYGDKAFCGVKITGRLKQYLRTGVDHKDACHVGIIAEHVEYRPELNLE